MMSSYSMGVNPAEGELSTSAWVHVTGRSNGITVRFATLFGFEVSTPA